MGVYSLQPPRPGIGNADDDQRDDAARVDERGRGFADAPVLALLECRRRIEEILAVVQIQDRIVPAAIVLVARGQKDGDVAVVRQKPRMKAAVFDQAQYRSGHGHSV